ncbi:TPA: MFS transporter [Legionella pneumophila]|nr:MFS transporter [Legionella pneumophila]HCJ1112918.1 MFS transporter [Legionella pneumophila]
MTELSVKNISALIIGNAFEWYDFFVYSFISMYFAKLFFPSTNSVNSILAVTATFGVALLMRPLGGVMLGVFADKYGRIRTMNLIILIMSLSLVLIAFAPTYNQIGIYAPILILVARLMQGFSTGAEFGVSSAILLELSPPNRRGFYSSLQTFGQMIAVQLSALVGLLLANYLTPTQIEQGGWRIPFILGLIILPVGMYIRWQVKETVNPSFKVSKYSLVHIIKNNIKSILITMGLVSGGTVSMYIILSYMPIYVTRYLDLTAHDSYCSVLVGVGLMTLLIPFFGWLSDHIGKKPLLVISMLLYLIEIYPCFLWLNAAPSLTRLIIIQCLFCFSLAMYYGAITAAMTDLFPKEVRVTCLSIGFNLGVMIFGAFAQFIVTSLIEVLATPMAITIYPLLGVTICLITAMYYQESDAKNMRSLYANQT